MFLLFIYCGAKNWVKSKTLSDDPKSCLRLRSLNELITKYSGNCLFGVFSSGHNIIITFCKCFHEVLMRNECDTKSWCIFLIQCLFDMFIIKTEVISCMLLHLLKPANIDPFGLGFYSPTNTVIHKFFFLLEIILCLCTVTWMMWWKFWWAMCTCTTL